MNRKDVFVKFSFVISGLLMLANTALARDVQYDNQEVTIRVTPGEPTQLEFPGKISGGFKRKDSAISLDKKDSDLIIFARESLSDQGEAIIVRLEDGRSYSIRAQRSNDESPRDNLVRILDERGSMILSKEEMDPAYKEKNYEYAPPTAISGLMREMVLVTEFGKGAVPGYQISEKYRGEVVLDDGTLSAKIDKLIIGPNLWGYIIDAENRLDVVQRINPATFRLDGTRAISMQNWELAAKPLNIEHQIAGKHQTKIYIVTKPKSAR